jgi:rare lipoprotein A
VQKLDVVARPIAPLAPTPIQIRQADPHGFFLQAGSFADLANANRLRDKLRAAGQVSIVAAKVNGADHYRVMVGPWTSRDDAEAAQNRLSLAGTDTIVVAK